ncbi:MAG TPA: YggT family protein [Steroidobacteraceae bacterium]|nr:YggT family protein [Steroidobacteraceae bacterium]
MTEAFEYVVDTLLTLALFVFLARLLLQWTRADFRNPLSQAIVRLTNPLVMPLRRLLPPIGKLDTASVVAVIVVALIEVALDSLIRVLALPPALIWVREAALEIARTLLWTYTYAIVLYAILSMVAQAGYSPLQGLLRSLCEPVLRPFRRIPSPQGLDLSPLWAVLFIQVIRILLR